MNTNSILLTPSRQLGLSHAQLSADLLHPVGLFRLLVTLQGDRNGSHSPSTKAQGSRVPSAPTHISVWMTPDILSSAKEGQSVSAHGQGGSRE